MRTFGLVLALVATIGATQLPSLLLQSWAWIGMTQADTGTSDHDSRIQSFIAMMEDNLGGNFNCELCSIVDQVQRDHDTPGLLFWKPVWLLSDLNGRVDGLWPPNPRRQAVVSDQEIAGQWISGEEPPPPKQAA